VFRTGFILNRRSDAVWFLGLPFLAVGAALAAREWLPAVAAASVALWITIPHHFATWLRTYGFTDEWRRWKDRLVLGPIVILGATLVGLKYAPLTVLLLVMLWDHQHSVMQQFGFARIYDFKARTGAPLTARFDLALNGVLYVNLFLTTPFFTEAWVRELYRWGVPVTLGAVELVHGMSWIVTGLFAVVYVGHVGWSVANGYSVNPVKYAFIAASYFLWYFVAWNTSSFLLYQIAHKIMHGVQYIVIVYWYIRRKVERAGTGTSVLAYVAQPGNVKAFLLMAVLYAFVYKLIIGGGLEEFGFGVVNVTLPYDSVKELGLAGMTYGRGYDLFAAALIQSLALVHYYFDSFIWKVRDEKTQSGL
jgi:hypothetical protein